MRFTPRRTARVARKRSRTLPIYGNPEMGDGKDDGKYFRCWNCGFVCNVERDALGDSESLSGVSYEIYEQKYSTDGSPAPFIGAAIHGEALDGEALIRKCCLYTGHVLLENGPDGTAKGIYRNWSPLVSAGCPFCGSRNWRGDY
jgi:hypothetical protein